VQQPGVVNVKHAISVMLLMFMALPLGGDLCRARHTSGPSIALEHQEIPELRELRRQGNILFRAGDYLKAIQTYESGYQEATRRGDMGSALRFLNNLGSADYQLFRYRDATKAYLKARELAISQPDRETLAAIYFNLSSLYEQMGEIDAANESARRGLELPPEVSAKFRSRLLIQSAVIQIRQRNWDRAILGLRQAIDLARAQRDVTVEAQAWNELGNALLECGRLSTAEAALLESFRLRSVSHDERLHFSYESLGELRLRQNDRASALAFFDKAIQSAATLGPVALWRPFYERGTANLADSHLRAAYADFGAALKSLEIWQAEVVPADAFRVSSEGEMHEVYSAYIELGARLYRQTGQERYVAESFAAAEASRAASLRTLWLESGLTKELPSDYWQTLSVLQAAESAQLSSASNDGTIRGLRLKLTEMEAAAALELPRVLRDPDPSANQLLQRTRRALRGDEVFIGFHIGDSESCLWAITHDALEFRALPPLAELNRDINAFVKAVVENSGEADIMGRQLYDRLFGSISPGLQQKPTWVLAPDGPLFDLPFAALVQSTTLKPREYLIERHAIRIVPGISALVRSPPPETDELFVGVGDPIYNRADLRWSRARRPLARSAVNASPDSSLGRILELPRLIGSAREVESCAEIWRANGRQALVLEGTDANQRNLAEALQHNPSVLHIAAHVLFPSPHTGLGMLALGLQPNNQVELLSATEIASMRAKLGLVVVDGCSSGHGAILPGTGLMGMTRAWLVAGARAVIATRWPAADQDTGELFSSLYRLYFSQRSHAPISFGKLLREAQLSELHAGGPHAAPAYWAKYFCVETN
jgi:CHAT domain-containing protein/Flp pilus assembly protein TadD